MYDGERFVVVYCNEHGAVLHISDPQIGYPTYDEVLGKLPPRIAAVVEYARVEKRTYFIK